MTPQNDSLPQRVAAYQRQVFSLATGALALSIAFRKDIAGESPSELWLLSVVWIAFSITVLSYIAALAVDLALEVWPPTSPSGVTTRHKVMIAIPSFILSASFVTGIGGLVWFAVLNNR